MTEIKPPYHSLDEKLVFEDHICMRCGLDKAYHKKKAMGEHVIPCIRKKPYKLRDGVEVKLGMQVWICHPFDDVTGVHTKGTKLKTGLVRSIMRWGSLRVWKFPIDRDQNKIFDICWEPSFEAGYCCFSSEESAETFRKKIPRFA